MTSRPMTAPRPSTLAAADMQKKFEIIAVPRHGRGVAHGQRAVALDDGN
jgi:hypothetical protein